MVPRVFISINTQSIGFGIFMDNGLPGQFFETELSIQFLIFGLHFGFGKRLY